MRGQERERDRWPMRCWYAIDMPAIADYLRTGTALQRQTRGRAQVTHGQTHGALHVPVAWTHGHHYVSRCGRRQLQGGQQCADKPPE